MLGTEEIEAIIKENEGNNKFDIYSLFEGRERESIEAAELAIILDMMSFQPGIMAFSRLPFETQIKVFPFLDISGQQKVIRHISRARAAYLLNELSSDNRTTFFNDLKLSERSKYINYLSDENKTLTLEILNYPEDSVARLIDTDYATITEDMTVKEAGYYLRENHSDTESINVLYIIDPYGKLVDDIEIHRLVLSDQHRKIKELMDRTCVTLNINDSQENAVQKFKDYDRVIMPVVDDDNVMMGVVTVDDIMDVAEQIETEDIQKFGGVESLDFPYVKIGFFKLAEKRATWLILLFLGEMLTATAMGYFEDEIATAVVLALFIPLIISSGGNSGSQAATLIIRALSIKEISLRDWWFVIRREILQGVVLGLIIGTIGFLRITIWELAGWYEYGDHWILIALTIFCSLTGIVLWGTLTGSMIPLLLKKIKLDPATSSAPFVATLVDVTGLIIYFTIAAAILSGTVL